MGVALGLLWVADEAVLDETAVAPADRVADLDRDLAGSKAVRVCAMWCWKVISTLGGCGGSEGSTCSVDGVLDLRRTEGLGDECRPHDTFGGAARTLGLRHEHHGQVGVAVSRVTGHIETVQALAKVNVGHEYL